MPILIGILFKALDAAMDDPEIAVVIVSAFRKVWFALNCDPAFRAKLEVLDKSLADPNMTIEERQNVLKQISNSHPKV